MAQVFGYRRNSFAMRFANAQQEAAQKSTTEEESFESLGAAGEKVAKVPFDVIFTIARGSTVFYCHLNDGTRFAEEGVVTPQKPNGESVIPLGAEGELWVKVSNNAKQVKTVSPEGAVRRHWSLKPKFVLFKTAKKVYCDNGAVFEKSEWTQELENEVLGKQPKESEESKESKESEESKESKGSKGSK